MSTRRWMAFLGLAFLALVPQGPAAHAVAAAPRSSEVLLLWSHDWLGGHGANVYKNTYPCCNVRSYIPPNATGDTQPLHRQPSGYVNIGISYQCVELAQRLYQELGWHAGRFGV